MEPSYGQDSFCQNDQTVEPTAQRDFGDDAKQDPLEKAHALCSGIEHRGLLFWRTGPSYLFHFAIEINLAHLRPTSQVEYQYPTLRRGRLRRVGHSVRSCRMGTLY